MVSVIAKRLAACVALVLFVGGCAETSLLTNSFKKLKDLNRGEKSIGKYKIGDPYEIKGVWYYPEVDYEYRETGVASWYGPNFHNKRTANGETYDQNAMTAAHRTLPMPSAVRVTNLENGRAVIVRINDRGPFAHGRIIDMSRRGAQLLDFKRKGTARVRVEIIPDESRVMASRAKQGLSSDREDIAASRKPAKKPDAAPVSTVAVASLAPLPGAKPAAPVLASTGQGAAATNSVQLIRQSRAETQSGGPIVATRLFVQAAAFANPGNAQLLRAKLADIGSAEVFDAMVRGERFYRVRIGPLTNVAQADRVLDSVISRGFPGARIIVD